MMQTKDQQKDQQKAAAGQAGGSVTSRRKVKASRLNGQKGGRPRLRPAVVYECLQCGRQQDAAASRAPHCSSGHRAARMQAVGPC